MSWIILIPPNEMGGNVRVVGSIGGKIASVPWPPLLFDSHDQAAFWARQFRCGIVVEANEPLRLATSTHEREED